MVPEQRIKVCTQRVCRMVQEQRCREECYKVCRMVKETCVKQVPVCVTRPVHYKRTIEVCRMVPTKVPYTVIRCVPKVVYREVPCLPACEPSCCMDPAFREPEAAGPGVGRVPTPVASEE